MAGDHQAGLGSEASIDTSDVTFAVAGTTYSPVAITSTWQAKGLFGMIDEDLVSISQKICETCHPVTMAATAGCGHMCE